MFKKILVATDLSEASDHVIGCLHGLKQIGAEQSLLVYALGIRHLEVMKYELARLAEPRLHAQKTMLEKQGFVTDILVASGQPSFEINRVANEQRASLIVVGSHGATLAKEVMLGGVAMAILHKATVPVLVIRLKITDLDAQIRCEVICTDLWRHILFCTDFSDTAERAFAYVEKIVESGTQRVTLLHVQDKIRIGTHLSNRLEEFNRIDQTRLERLKTQLEAKGAMDVRIEIPYGSPIQEILRRTKDEDVSLVVMGSQGRGFITEVFIGSVSHHVVRGAGVPVLLVPALR